MTSHSRSYGEELQRSIFVQIASAIGDLESVIGIITHTQQNLEAEAIASEVVASSLTYSYLG